MGIGARAAYVSLKGESMFRLVLLVLDFFASYPSPPTGDIGGGWDPDGLHGNLDPDG